MGPRSLPGPRGLGVCAVSLFAEPAPLTIFEDFIIDIEDAKCLNCGEAIFRHFGAKTWAHVVSQSTWCERSAA